MCQIWIKEKGVMLPRTFWGAICAYNQEGIGIYDLDADFILKSQDYEDGWKYIEANLSHRMIVHHRLSTSGAKTCEQLHGWDMGNGHVFFHNGILKTYDGTTLLSDTQQFVEEWQGVPLKPMVKYLEETESSSRFVIVNRQTKEITLPKCARWNPVYIDELGVTVQFSNDYAFSYSMLPSKYGRWGAYDRDWGYSGGAGRKFINESKTKKTTRSGATTKKTVKSVLEAQIGGHDVILNSDSVFNATTNTYQNLELGIEFLTYPTRTKNTLIADKSFVFPDICRVIGTNDFYDMAGILAYNKGGAPTYDESYADLTIMNDVLTCKSGDLVRMFVRLARKSDKLTSEIDKAVINTSIYKYIRSYELRIGERKDNKLTLVHFIKLCAYAEDRQKTLTSPLQDMALSSCLVEALADSMNDSDKYFKPLYDRTVKQFELNLDAELAKVITTKADAKSKVGDVGKGVTNDDLIRYATARVEDLKTKALTTTLTLTETETLERMEAYATTGMFSSLTS